MSNRRYNGDFGIGGRETGPIPSEIKSMTSAAPSYSPSEYNWPACAPGRGPEHNKAGFPDVKVSASQDMNDDGGKMKPFTKSRKKGY